MTLLTFDSKYLVQSSSVVTTTSSTLADDAQASQTFSLDGNHTVLAIYTANSNYADTNYVTGIKNAIEIDGTDYSQMNDSGYAANHALRNTCIWVGTLGAGSHTITGQLAAVTNGHTVTVSNRTLLLYIFNGDEFGYIDNTTSQATTSNSYVDDSSASLTGTPSGSCTVLVFYAVTNLSGTTERYTGKRICISIGGSDYTACEAAKGSNPAGTAPDSVATVYAVARAAVSTNVQGRFSTDYGGQSVSIDRRVLAVLCLDSTIVLDIDSDSTKIGTSTSNLANDTYNSISRTTAAELLVFTQARKFNLTDNSMYGMSYGLKVDTVDVSRSRCSTAYTTTAESNFVTYAATMASGAHTITGRFSNNLATTAVYVDKRIMVALWLPPTTVLPCVSSLSGSGTTSANIGRFSRIASVLSGSGAVTADIINLSTTVNLASFRWGGGSETGQVTLNIMVARSIRTSDGYAVKTSNGYFIFTSEPSIPMSSSTSGGGSETATILITTYNPIISSVSGDGSLTAYIEEFLNVLSSISGDGSLTANITGFLNILSSVYGGGSETANMTEFLNVLSSMSGGGIESSNTIEYELLITSVYGGGSETANITNISNTVDISTFPFGGGSETANITVVLNILGSVSGSGSEDATIQITTYIPIISSFSGDGSEDATIQITTYNPIISSVSGGGSLTAYIEELINLVSDVSASGSLTANMTLFDYLVSSISASGTSEAAISLNQIISGIASGAGDQIVNAFILEMLNSNVVGVGNSFADQVTTIYLTSVLEGGGSQITILRYCGRDFKSPLTYIVYQKTRTATIYQKTRTVTFV